MSHEQQIHNCWNHDTPVPHDVLEDVLSQLDDGRLRVAHATSQGWHTHEWVKKAILLYFKQTQSHLIQTGTAPAYDKVPLKCKGWVEKDFQHAGFRMTPGAIVRRGAFVGTSAVLMPCFVNIGAFVDSGTMIDTGARVGSCAQVGSNCHISGGVGLGGVLEPPSATPVIIEDNCFIGAQSQVVEGAHIGTGSVLGMGTLISSSTKVIDRTTGKTYQGHVPPYSVVIPGSYEASNQSETGTKLFLNCAVIIKRVDEKTRAKTSTNDLLRG